MRDLFAKHREINTQIKNLVDVMEKGGLGSVHSVQERFAARQTELDEINRLIALRKRALETPITKVTAEKAEAFAVAFRSHLRGQGSPAFRRAYLRLMLDKVVVGKDAIRISGPKSVLAHQLTAEKLLPPSLVPTFVDGWRPQGESNPCFRRERATSWAARRWGRSGDAARAGGRQPDQGEETAKPLLDPPCPPSERVQLHCGK